MLICRKSTLGDTLEELYQCCSMMLCFLWTVSLLQESGCSKCSFSTLLNTRSDTVWDTVQWFFLKWGRGTCQHMQEVKWLSLSVCCQHYLHKYHQISWCISQNELWMIPNCICWNGENIASLCLKMPDTVHRCILSATTIIHTWIFFVHASKEYGMYVYI